jgi:hypothetical protein
VSPSAAVVGRQDFRRNAAHGSTKLARKQRKKCTDLSQLTKRAVKDSTKPRGFFRVNIVEHQADGSQRIGAFTLFTH